MEESRLDTKIQEELQQLGVAVVYLYGSEALQRSSRLSDMDVGVVLREPRLILKDRRQRYALYAKLLEHLERSFSPDSSREIDLVFLQAASPVLQFEAINAGCPLFVADPTFLADYEASVMRAYRDIRPLVETHFQAVLERAA